VSQALAMAESFQGAGVTWFEEPVPYDDFDGLARVRAGLPPGMELATGEYGSDAAHFVRLLRHGATDVMQADATRCGGVTGFLAAAQIAAAWQTPLSSHTAPSLHVHLDAAAPPPFRHLEYFRDHARLEGMLFEGAAEPERGDVVPDPKRPGLGLELREREAERFAVSP
jgi:L-alanine-DL-glutamate epimerase-like enolase superfamily enzyme